MIRFPAGEVGVGTLTSVEKDQLQTVDVCETIKKSRPHSNERTHSRFFRTMSFTALDLFLNSGKISGNFRGLRVESTSMLDSNSSTTSRSVPQERIGERKSSVSREALAAFVRTPNLNNQHVFSGGLQQVRDSLVSLVKLMAKERNFRPTKRKGVHKKICPPQSATRISPVEL